MSFCLVRIEKGNLSPEDLGIITDKAFEDFGCEGKHFFDIDEAKVDEILGKRAYSGGDIPDEVIWEVEALSEENEKYLGFYFDRASLRNFALFLEKDFPHCKFQIKDIEDKDWNEEWKKTYAVIKVNEDLNIVPEWEKEKDRAQDVYIYPGMGFGTGSHETTFLCLSELTKWVDKEKEIECLDFGCGSGILGIAAIKRNKARVDFVDIDPNALDNCVQNLELNEFQNYKEGHGVILRDRYKEKKYDLVFANILENILIAEKKTLLNSLKKNGILILSGLLNDQKQNIINNYSEHVEHIDSMDKGDWSCLVFRGKA